MMKMFHHFYFKIPLLYCNILEEEDTNTLNRLENDLRIVDLRILEKTHENISIPYEIDIFFIKTSIFFNMPHHTNIEHFNIQCY